MKLRPTAVISAALMTGVFALGGCASIGSVKQAQATADQALSQAQAANAAAQHAQSSADQANAAAQQAQSTAQAATQTAQAAQAQAQATGQQVQDLSTRMERMRAPARHHGRHHRHRHHVSGGGKGERG
jgi:hypothetical protein